MIPHRSGSLKQQNKRHKAEKKRSDEKSAVTSKKTPKFLSKRDRRAILKQKRAVRLTTLRNALNGRGTKENPIWCVLVPLTTRVPIHLAKLLLQKCDQNVTVIDAEESNLQQVVKLYYPALDRHFCFVSTQVDDLFCRLDLVLQADWTIIVVPSDFTQLDRVGELFLTALYAQGLGNVSFVVMSSGANLKEVKLNLESRFPIPEDTVHPLNTSLHAVNLLRHISLTTNLGVANKLRCRKGPTGTSHSAARFRAKLLVESISLSDQNGSSVNISEILDPSDAYLRINGRLRGAPLYLSEPLERVDDAPSAPHVHLTGWGDFPLSAASWVGLQLTKQRWSVSDAVRISTAITSTVYRSSEAASLAIEEDDSECSNSIESFQPSEDEDDPSDNRPVDAMSPVSQPMEVEGDVQSDDGSWTTYAARTTVSSKGSTFSAAQLAKFRAARMEEMFPDEVETPPAIPARERFSKYRCLPRFHGSNWPLEKDTLPVHYDDIACFRNYHRNRRSVINYLRDRAVKTAADQIPSTNYINPGTDVQLVLGPMHLELAQMILQKHTMPPSNLMEILDESPNLPCPPPPLVLWSLLPHESRISVCHFAMRRLTSALRATSDLIVVANAANRAAQLSASKSVDTMHVDLGEEASSGMEQEVQSIRDALTSRSNRRSVDKKSTSDTNAPFLPPEAEPIKSKDLMLFQVGIRRFVSAPIYSTPTSAPYEKAKFEPFFSTTESCVMASVYAPVMYAPANVLQFRIRVDEDDDGTLSSPYLGELVATGTLHSVDPSRLLIKRILLSGHPYKIRNRNVVVRFMFFNPLDIEYFKAVPLHTKSGAAGHIKEPVGTHGHMKCVFDRPLQSSDVVLLPLYKRVFPKWCYQPVVSKALQSRTSLAPTYEWHEAPVKLQLTKKQSSSSNDDLSNERIGVYS